MGDYTYRLSLRIEHPDADLSHVPGKLKLVANRLWKKGDPRLGPNGRPLGGVYQDSFCGIRFGADFEKTSVPQGIKAALDLLKPHRDFLIALAESGASLTFFVGWFSESTARDVFAWDLLQALADLRISLDLDFYGPDPIVETAPETP